MLTNFYIALITFDIIEAKWENKNGKIPLNLDIILYSSQFL